MTQEQISELIVTFRSNRAFRKLVLDVLRDELVPEMKVRTAGREEPVVRIGLLSYKEVQQILDCPLPYVRKLVYNAAIDGRDGYVDEQSLVRWATTNAKRTYRERVVDWAKTRNERLSEQRASKVRKREMLVQEESSQMRLAV
jgi:hypothetical protein